MISKIFVSGGSQCIAGGFLHEEVKKVYNENFNIEINNHLDYAYPNILAKKLNVDIINEGASGGSITRMIRKTYEYITKNKKDINETLFIFEVPPGWRDEYYSNELNRYVNMTIGNICSPHDITDAANGHNPNDIFKIHKDISNFFITSLMMKLTASALVAVNEAIATANLLIPALVYLLTSSFNNDIIFILYLQNHTHNTHPLRR
jgi:hypothetical protein